MECTTEYAEFHRRFLRMEEDFDLFSLSINGVPIWERIRLDVARSILDELGIWGQPHTQVEPSARDYLHGLGLLAKSTLLANPFLFGEHELLYWGHSRRKLENGSWWDIYCDPIHDAATFDYLHVEDPYLNDHKSPPKTGRLGYLEPIEYMGLLQRKVGLADVTLSAADERRLATVRRWIRDEFGGGGEAVREHARHQLELRKSNRWLYDALLDRVDPEVVVLVVSYGKETFIEACQDRSIPVVELQHGDINWYSYEYSFPGDRTKEAFPDYVLTFGEFWNRRAEYPIPQERVVDVGYPYLETQLESSESVTEKPQIVFVSNGASGWALSRLAVELSRRRDRELDIVYQLHPGEYDRWRQEYPHLEDADLEVVDSSDPSLYRVLAESKAQVGTYSTALYEGLAFGLDTYLLEVPTIEWMQPMIDRGDATLVRSAEELVSALRTSDGGVHRSETPFEPNATENAVAAIREILEGTR